MKNKKNSYCSKEIACLPARQASSYRFAALLAMTICFLFGCATVPRAVSPAISTALQEHISDINGTSYVPLIVACDRFNYKWSWDTVARKAGIQNSKIYIRFMEGSSFVLVNDRIEKMPAPAILHQGALMVPVSFVQSRILPPQLKAAQPERPRAVVPGKYLLGKAAIDAGHGGKDPGAIGRTGLMEKEVTLNMAKRLKRKLEEEGFIVYLTRSDDRFVSLSKRPQMANDWNADFFVSIHVNAARIKNAKGFEVYYLSEAADAAAKRLAEEENASLKFEQASYKVNSGNHLENILWDLVSTENRAESIQLASHVSKQARKNLWVYQRGVKSAGFYVLKGARMPAILVETGFITNRDEEARLKDPAYRDDVADAIAKGILNYRDEYQVHEGFTK